MVFVQSAQYIQINNINLLLKQQKYLTIIMGYDIMYLQFYIVLNV